MKHIMTHRGMTLLTALALGTASIVGCEKEPETTATSESATQSAPATQENESAASSSSAETEARHAAELMHVHGLAYTSDGKKLVIPSHHGLAVYDGTSWSQASGPAHDYMGFSPTKDAIYSSGHPAPNSGLPNPFGVIKSTDGGRTWKNLGMEGESDFHLLAAGYQTNAIYVINPFPNSKMKEAGIYASFNDGFSWQRAAGKGIDAEPISLAAHPTDAKTVAIGNENGLFLSKNGGDAFERIVKDEVVASYFDLNGKQLWFTTVDGKSELSFINLQDNTIGKVTLPEMKEDAVAYVAQNPSKLSEYAVATFKRSVYTSQDGGKTWRQIADNGKTL